MIDIVRSGNNGFDIKIGSSEYHFDTSDGYPVIYNNTGRLAIPNVDNWCLSQTHGQLSYREIKLMAEAYKIGFENGLRNSNLDAVEKDFCKAILKVVFEDGIIDKLMDLYYIECAKESSFISKSVPDFIKNLAAYRKKYDPKSLREILDRIYKRLEMLRQTHLLSIVKELYKLIDYSPHEPVYPDITDVVDEIIKLKNIKSEKKIDFIR